MGKRSHRHHDFTNDDEEYSQSQHKKKKLSEVLHSLQLQKHENDRAAKKKKEKNLGKEMKEEIHNKKKKKKLLKTSVSCNLSQKTGRGIEEPMDNLLTILRRKKEKKNKHHDQLKEKVVEGEEEKKQRSKSKKKKRNKKNKHDSLIDQDLIIVSSSSDESSRSIKKKLKEKNENKKRSSRNSFSDVSQSEIENEISKLKARKRKRSVQKDATQNTTMTDEDIGTPYDSLSEDKREKKSGSQSPDGKWKRKWKRLSVVVDVYKSQQEENMRLLYNKKQELSSAVKEIAESKRRLYDKEQELNSAVEEIAERKRMEMILEDSIKIYEVGLQDLTTEMKITQDILTQSMIRLAESINENKDLKERLSRQETKLLDKNLPVVKNVCTVNGNDGSLVELYQHKKFKCELCGKKCYTNLEISRHVKRHIINCNKCGKGYTGKNNLFTHLKTHDENFKCHICNKNLSSKQSLQYHNKSYHSKRFSLLYM